VLARDADNPGTMLIWDADNLGTVLARR
jgi:hypothetical protein